MKIIFLDKGNRTMKRKLLPLLTVLLVSCNQVAYAEETISKPAVSDKRMSFSEDEKKYLKEESSVDLTVSDNCVVSPASLRLVDSYQNDKDTFSALYKKLNQKEDDFELSDKFSVASTEAIADKSVSNVSYFEGTIDKLNNSLSRFYDKDVKLANNGTYYFSMLNLNDRFLIPQKTKKDMEFNGEGKHTYVELTGDYSTVISDVYTYVSFTINQTELRILFPAENHSMNDVSVSDFYQQNTEKKRVHAYVPEFEKEYQYVKMDTSGFRYQGNKFMFDHYGVSASSFTVKGPTDVDPSYDLELTLDRPFLYASFYDDVMLFYGAVSSL